MTEQLWHTMIVRVWRDRDGLKIRFTTDDRRPGPVEATVEAACRHFESWLRTVDQAAPVVPPDPVRRPRTRCDDDREADGQTTAS
ncbi:hypothetical protein [Kribbella endophytica]